MRNTNSAIILHHIDSARFNGPTDLFHALAGIEDGLIDARGKASVEEARFVMTETTRFVDVFFNTRDEFEVVPGIGGHALDLVEEFDEVEGRVEGAEGCGEYWDYWLRHFDDAW
jgi:hypothetical protein